MSKNEKNKIKGGRVGTGTAQARLLGRVREGYRVLYEVKRRTRREILHADPEGAADSASCSPPPGNPHDTPSSAAHVPHRYLAKTPSKKLGSTPSHSNNRARRRHHQYKSSRMRDQFSWPSPLPPTFEAAVVRKFAVWLTNNNSNKYMCCTALQRDRRSGRRRQIYSQSRKSAVTLDDDPTCGEHVADWADWVDQAIVMRNRMKNATLA